MPYILAIDSGTTSSRTIIYNEIFQEVAKAQQEFAQLFPKPGWVEHDAMEIYNSQYNTIWDAIENYKIPISEIACIGIANQRETIVVWNKQTGIPIYNAIVWQDRRTSDYCEALKKNGKEKIIAEKTGLIIDAYFSASKINWILNNVSGAKQSAINNELLCGTIDTWLIWKFTEGKVHATDASNASRTMLMNIHTGEWDEELLQIFDIPIAMLPQIKNSSDTFGDATIYNSKIPITGVAGDQQAALFGQQCFEIGSSKNTYGTGCFMLMNTGETAVHSKHNMLTTIAWRINNKTTYALEGSVFIAGAVIQWLRDSLQIINTAEETENIAAQLQDNGGVYFIPAFTGLGAPHWNQDVRGTITGLTRGTGKAHLVRAALESIAYQVRDVFDAMQQDAGIKLQELKVDGGASVNNWLMQFQSDILQTPVIRNQYSESTALGAAMLASIDTKSVSPSSWQNFSKQQYTFSPQMNTTQSEQYYNAWKSAVANAIRNNVND
ncbi:MAG: glycerol kinase GlpK [Chitinophagales bacterium]